MNESERMVPRVVEAKDSTELFTLAHLILSTPCPLDRVDAIAVMPGLGEHDRVMAAARAYESNLKVRYLLVAGTYAGEKAQPQPSLEYLKAAPINLQRFDNVKTQVSASNTVEQVEWLLQTIKSQGITSLAVVVSHWHLPRAYGTLLKSMVKADLQIPAFPVAVPSEPYRIVPETGVSVAKMSAGEAERIIVYQKKGDVVSLTELEDYLSWLWKQNIAPIRRGETRRD